MRTADQPIRISLFAPDGPDGPGDRRRRSPRIRGFAIDQDHGDVLVDFSAPGRAAGEPRPRGCRPDIPILVGTTGLDDVADKRHRSRRRARSRSCARRTPRSASPCSRDLVERAAARARARLGHRDRRDASPQQGRRAVGHRADARPVGGQGRGKTLPERGRDRHRPHARSRARSASPRCAAARSPATMT